MRVIYFSHSEEREGKSYGGPHLGSHRISPASDGVFGLVHIQGNVDTDILLGAMSITLPLPGSTLISFQFWVPKRNQKNLQECIQADLQTSS